MARRVEIAGGGIAGLAAAAALARRGWRVRVHEQSPEPRTYGAGIYVWENGLRVLEALGAYEDATRGALPAWRRDGRDAQGRLFRSNEVRGMRLFTIVRGDLLAALDRAARRAGAEIVYGAEASAADPEGRLRVGGAWLPPADLVVAADGIGSRVRDGLGLLAWRRRIDQFAIRALIRREPAELGSELGRAHCEHWNGTRRLLYAPCTASRAYVQLTALAHDPEGTRLPIDRAFWRRQFPHAAWIVDRLPDEGRGDRFEILKLRRWSAGRVAVIGDAAHAQPPNLGQGGGCSLMAALGLAVALDRAGDVEAALALWERRERPLIERTQNVAFWYGRLAFLPDAVRGRVLRAIDAAGWLRRRTLLAATLHEPTGTAGSSAG